jgi:tRNA A-37 threonylcarbamoyl transferase component Bud32/tetratricopeptide (TPR) repeat protein
MSTTDRPTVQSDGLPDEPQGQTLGRYKLLERIGEGGFGVVYVAEQKEPVKRRVALKIIKLGMDTRQVVARFEAERQALALMDHPNIAKVLDAGATDSGRPYFVMELVRGVKLTDYCDQHKLSTKQRLELFIPVCQAIQHAHQKGIIHRDIKPSNILVTLHDGVPVPKVIDFGIAKATQQDLTDKTVYTQLHQFVGTPAYMSPEQAEMSGLDVDTRSDIYSLGVLLYELLTGGTPFDTKELVESGVDEMRKIIREREPVRPSTRLTQLRGQGKSQISNLRSEIPSDLDWIVMKCLEKDRTRRYETANGLAADVRRHLNNEPVLACPPSTAYRLQKAFRRNKLLFTAGFAVAGALLFGIVGTTLGLLHARAAKALALQTRSDAEKLSNFMLDDFYYELLPIGQFSTVGRLAQKALEYYDSLPTALRTSETARNRAMAQARLALVLVRVSDFRAAISNAEESASLLERHRNQGDASEGTARALAVALLAQGTYHEIAGNLPEAAAALKRAVAVLQPFAQDSKGSERARLQYAVLLSFLCHAQKPEEGVATCNEAFRVLESLGALDWKDLDAASSWADTADSQARLLLGLGRIDEAERVQRQALKLAEGVVARRPSDLHARLVLSFVPDLLGLIEARRNHEGLALDWFRKGKLAAEDSLRFNPADGASFFSDAVADYTITAMLLRAGRITEAQENIRQASTNAMPEYLGFGQWSSLALLEAQRGNRAAAEGALLEAKKRRGAVVEAVAISQHLKSFWAEADHDAERQTKLAFGEDAAVLESTQAALVRFGELGKAEEDADRLAFLNQLKRRALSDGARAALNLRQWAEAESLARALLAAPLLRTELSERMMLRQPDDLGWARLLLAEAQLGQGHAAEALKTLEPAVAVYHEMQAAGVAHLSFHQRFARALYVQALAQPATDVGASQRRSSLAQAARLLNELSDEAKQLHDSKELLAWIQAEEQKSPPGGHP